MTNLPNQPTAAERVRREAATARHARSVHDLLEQRPELLGVLSLPDLVRDAVRWAA